MDSAQMVSGALTLLFLLFVSSNGSFLIEKQIEYENQTPIIGVLSQELSLTLKNLYPEYKSYIAASYVKFIESAGARVVPIWTGKDKQYYADLLGKVNGVLFPGGGCYFTNIDGYADAGEKIYQVAKELNDQGDFFPIFGTCLGFQLLTYLSANRTELRADCSSQSQSLSLDFLDDFKSSRLFENASDNVISVLSEKNITSNFHSYCVTRANFTRFNIDDEWKILSDNKDWNDFTFISAVESKKYPFYGVQFHPEKNLFEWVENRNISHTKDAILGNRYFADFFLSEAKKNSHHFENKTDEQHSLIYNFPTTYTGTKVSYDECYFFK